MSRPAGLNYFSVFVRQSVPNTCPCGVKSASNSSTPQMPRMRNYLTSAIAADTADIQTSKNVNSTSVQGKTSEHHGSNDAANACKKRVTAYERLLKNKDDDQTQSESVRRVSGSTSLCVYIAVSRSISARRVPPK